MAPFWIFLFLSRNLPTASFLVYKTMIWDHSKSRLVCSGSLLKTSIFGQCHAFATRENFTSKRLIFTYLGSLDSSGTEDASKMLIIGHCGHLMIRNLLAPIWLSLLYWHSRKAYHAIFNQTFCIQVSEKNLAIFALNTQSIIVLTL